MGAEKVLSVLAIVCLSPRIPKKGKDRVQHVRYRDVAKKSLIWINCGKHIDFLR